MPKITIYNAPTSNNSNRAIVSIPDSVQLNDNVSTIDLNQSESSTSDTPLLAAVGDTVPSNTLTVASVNDPAYSNPVVAGGLFGQTVGAAAPVALDANKSVQITNLLPGATISGVMQDVGVSILPYVEINRVQIPSGFVPLEDLTAYENYAYNTANLITNGELKLLPGDQVTESDVRYGIEVNGDKLTVSGSTFVDSVQVDWLNTQRNDGKSDWTTMGIFPLSYDPKMESYEKTIQWKKPGSYIFRIVPIHKGYPLPGFKTIESTFDIAPAAIAQWTSLQLDKNKFRLRLEGPVSQNLNYCEIYEDNKCLAKKIIIRDSNDYVATDIDVDNVSNKKYPKLSVYWYKKDSFGMVYYYEETISLSRNFAKESVELRVESTADGKNFTFFITDPKNQLYKPVSQIEPFNGIQWDQAIRDKKLMAYIEITRHQNGDIVNMGHYPVNITQNSDNTNVIEGSPFVFKNRNGTDHSLTWSETQEFRQLANVATADITKDVVYEFRMVFWTVGIEQCIRSGEEYMYLVEPSFDVNGATQTHRHAYNVWTFEHPSYRYTNLHALSIADSGESYLRYGRSYKGITRSGVPPIEESTKEINTESLGWQVLYHVDDNDDNVKQFPFYSFNIIVPATTLDSLDRIEVRLAKSGTLIGTYHPMTRINVVDFLGHYKHMKRLLFELDTAPVFLQIENSVSGQPVDLTSPTLISAAQADIPPMLVDNKIKAAADKRLTNVANLALGQKAKQVNIAYEIQMHFRDNTVETQRVRANTASIPEIPKEPNDNVSFTVGNPIINPNAMNVPTNFESALTNAIDLITIPDSETLENASSVVSTIGSFGVFR